MKLEPSDILKKNKDKNDKPEEFKPNRLDYSPDGKWLSIATKQGILLVTNVETQEQNPQLKITINTEIKSIIVH